MGITFFGIGIDTTAKGYFADSVTTAEPKLSTDPSGALWLKWQAVLDEAKQGNFGRTPELVDIYKTTTDWILARACADLLGDAGSRTVLEMMASVLGKGEDALLRLMMQVEFGDALGWHGGLWAVPLLVEAYKRINSFADATIIPVRLSDLLESEAGSISDPADFASIQEWADFTLGKYNEIRSRFGSDRVIIFQGNQYGVVSHARLLLNSLDEGTYDHDYRRRFEASTGINCSEFYRDESIQPLTAASMVETFLESSGVERFIDGVRYFFGHEIPD